jgi:23S rRNA (adenine2503-C2)-methyltransferase
VSLAYLVVSGLNDADGEIDAFLDRAVLLGRDVHLFAYNPVPTSAHAPVPRARYEAIYERMAATGLRVRMSSQARVEANGGCGTLVALRGRRVDRPPAPVG